MFTISVPRLVEEHAASRADRLAIVHGDRTIAYRELNQRANAAARRLIAHGFRRGSHADVCMPRGTDLALVLLAILKAGGSYTWSDPDRASAPCPQGVSISVRRSATEDECLPVDLSQVLGDDMQPSPNLPILTRGSDIACVLREDDASPAVHVPHATITALRRRSVPPQAHWVGEAGALDLWAALTTGATLIVAESPLRVAAA